MNKLELIEKRNALVNRCTEIVNLCKSEVREMTEDEEKEFNEKKAEAENLNEELKSLRAKLEEYEKNAPKADPEGDEKPEGEERNKYIEKSKMEKQNLSIVSEIRSAIANGTKHFKINADVEKRAMHVQGDDGVHDNVVETEMQGILEPLYAKSELTNLGVTWYTGLPMGDISIPVMGKGNVGWADEMAKATEHNNTFTNIKMTPNRLTAYVDVSKQLLAQDTIGVENAIRRDIVNAISDKLEATIFGSSAKTDNSPAGIFADGILNSAVAVTTFAGLCEQEATVEDANVYGEMKYLLNPKAKAILRAMSKSTKNTQLVLEGGSVDGVPADATSNVKTADGKAVAVYGDWQYLAIASWGDIDITVDEYTQAVNGCVRLVINSYFDAKVTRKEAFAVSTLN